MAGTRLFLEGRISTDAVRSVCVGGATFVGRIRMTICDPSFRVVCRSTCRGSVMGRAPRVVGRVLRGGSVRFCRSRFRTVKVICVFRKGACVVATTTCSNCKCRGRGTLGSVLVVLSMVKLDVLVVMNCLLTHDTLVPMSGVMGRIRDVSTRRVGGELPIRGGESRLKRLDLAFGRVLSQLRVTFQSRGVFIDGISRRLQAPVTTLVARLRLTLLGRHGPRRCRVTVGGIVRSSRHMIGLVRKLLGLTGTSCLPRRVGVRGDHLSRLLLSTQRLIVGTGPGCGMRLVFRRRTRSSSMVAILKGDCLLAATFIGLVRGGYGFSGGRASFVRVSF